MSLLTRQPDSGISYREVRFLVDVAGRAYAAASTGAIIRYASSGAEQLSADAAYHLELKCTGALIEGVQPQEQYQTLKHAGAG